MFKIGMLYLGLLCFFNSKNANATSLIYSFSRVEVKSIVSKNTHLCYNTFMLEEREKSSYLFQNTIRDFISISAEMLLDSNNTNVKKVQIDSTLHSKNLTDTTQLQAQTIDSTETSSHNYRPIIITYPRGYDKNRSPRYKLSGRVKYIKRNSSSVERTLRTMDNVWTTIKFTLLSVVLIAYIFR